MIAPKHLLERDVLSKGKLGEFSLTISLKFPSQGSFSLENRFLFPSLSQNGLFSHETKSWKDKKEFVGNIDDFPREGKFTSLPQRCSGHVVKSRTPNSFSNICLV